MTNEAPPLRQLYLHPGEIFVGSAPACISTVLGSCVTVTLFCRFPAMAAICHAMLPEPGRHQHHAPLVQPYKYVSHAIPAMLEQFEARGIKPDQIEAKLFGGADVIQVGVKAGASIGASNIERATLLLSAAGVEITGTSIGGTRGRKIRFHTDTGTVYLAHLSEWTSR